tara:strand:+ start:8771 stop:9934 length:1164 start_codon:yes stop_codon:yes gene_type:complete
MPKHYHTKGKKAATNFATPSISTSRDPNITFTEFNHPSDSENLSTPESTSTIYGPNHEWDIVRCFVDGAWHDVTTSSSWGPRSLAFAMNPLNQLPAIMPPTCGIHDIGCIVNNWLFHGPNVPCQPFEAFYDYAVQQTGALINIGDTVVWDIHDTVSWMFGFAHPTGSGNNYEKLCLEYKGKHTTTALNFLYQGNSDINHVYFSNPADISCCPAESCGTCEFSDMLGVAMQSTLPNGHPSLWTVYGPTMLNNPSQFYTFLNNMWNHFEGSSPGPTGCDWWLNRWNLWNWQYTGGGSVILINNPNHAALKEAKIDLAWQMLAACDCPEPNIAPPTPLFEISYTDLSSARIRTLIREIQALPKYPPHHLPDGGELYSIYNDLIAILRERK